MSNAWETTTDDIANALMLNGIEVPNDERLEEICDFQIDHDAVEKAALYGHEIDEQTRFAYDEIARQLNLR